MYLFYNPEIESIGNYVLSEEESKHAFKVLRLETGDEIQVTNGRGLRATGEVSHIDKKKVGVIIDHLEQYERKSPNLTIAISPIKSRTRWEWFIEKSTELGVCKIIPLICNRTEKQQINSERTVSIATAAIKQSQRYWLPILDEPKEFSQLMTIENGNKFIAHCDGFRKRKFINSVNLNEDSIILVGPEGGFSEQEIILAEENGFIGMSISKHRLRTETAGIACCQSFNFANDL